MLGPSKPRLGTPVRQTHTPPAKAPALEVSTTLVVRRRVAFLDRHPGVASWLLVLPGTIWMMLFVGIPLASIALFSFWRSGFAGLVPDYNVENYAALLGGRTFWRITFWTYEVVIMALAGVIVLAYPAAYAIWRVVRDDRWKPAVLLLCIVPFWTSYLTRTITWLPMFGREGVVNRVLFALGVIGEPLEILLYTPYSMMWGLWSLYIVFMIGPLYHSMTKIDEDVMSAAAMLGATTVRTFSTSSSRSRGPGGWPARCSSWCSAWASFLPSALSAGRKTRCWLGSSYGRSTSFSGRRRRLSR